MSITIKDIAKESGYSVSTVSRVINGHSEVSEKAKQKIDEVVNKYKFELNQTAKSLKQQSSKTVCIIAKGTFNVFLAQLVVFLKQYIVESTYLPIVYYIGEAENEVNIANTACRERKPSGIIFIGANIKNFTNGFKKFNVPVVLSTVMVGQDQTNGISSVSINDISAAAQACDLFIKYGHKKIAVIGGDPSISYVSALRLAGVRKSMSAHNLTFTEKYFEASTYSFEDGYEAAKRLLERCNDFTAVFAMSDILAISAIRAFTDAGLRVPQDISVIGFDGIEATQFFVPRITTVCQPLEEIAQKSFELLLQRIESNIPCKSVVINALLREGESVIKLK